MERNDLITFYHVTFQGSLKGFKNAGALITNLEQNNIGLRNNEDNQGYLEDSEGRVFASTEWFAVMRYINEIKERAERMGNEGILKYLVVLKITFPPSDFNILFARRPEEPTRQNEFSEHPITSSIGGPSSGSSHYFTPNYEPCISLHYISIAVSRIYKLNIHRQGEYQFGKNWWWMPVTEFDFQEGIYPVVPDGPFPRTTTTIDINQIVHEVVMREMNT